MSYPRDLNPGSMPRDPRACRAPRIEQGSFQFLPALGLLSGAPGPEMYRIRSEKRAAVGDEGRRRRSGGRVRATSGAKMAVEMRVGGARRPRTTTTDTERGCAAGWAARSGGSRRDVEHGRWSRSLSAQGTSRGEDDSDDEALGLTGWVGCRRRCLLVRVMQCESQPGMQSSDTTDIGIRD